LADLVPSPPSRFQGFVDVPDRILDKGLVIAGDVKINLANVELLTLRVRPLVCSIDKAEQIGIDWWKTDPSHSSGDPVRRKEENRDLRKGVALLEGKLEPLAAGRGSAGADPSLRGAEQA
jgi:hypothetical protein